MLTAILLLLLTGLTWTAVGVLFGKAPSDRDRLYSFFALNGMIFTFLVWVTRFPQPAPIVEVLKVAGFIVPSALMELVAFWLLKLAMDRGSHGVAWSVAQSAMLIAFLGSVWLLDSPASRCQWIGVAALLAGLALFGKTRNSAGPVRNDRVFFLYIFSTLLILGLGQFLRLVPNHLAVSPEALSWRLPLQSPFGMIVWMTVCLSRRQFTPGKVWRFSLPYALVVTLGQICFYWAADAAKAAGMTAIVMPVSIGSCIALFALYCRIFRHEPMKWPAWTATGLTVAGIALLSIA